MKTLITVFLMLSAPLIFAADSVSPTNVLSMPGGRYVFGQVGSLYPYPFMFDPQTGRLWRLVLQYNEKETNLVLAPVLYETVAGGRSLSPMDEQAEIAAVKAALATNSIEQKPTYGKKPADENKPTDEPKK